MIGIIGAMDSEVRGIVSQMAGAREEKIGSVTYHTGTLWGRETVAAVCGIGKVNAAICAQTMLLRFSPDFIVNTGVAGSLNSALKIGDVLVAESVCQHDMDRAPFCNIPGMLDIIERVHINCDLDLVEKLSRSAALIPDISVTKGKVVTGDQFVSSSAVKERLKNVFEGDACEMEGGAIGHVCFASGVPFVVVRAISDGGDEDAEIDFPAFVDVAAERSIRLLKAFYNII